MTDSESSGRESTTPTRSMTSEHSESLIRHEGTNIKVGGYIEPKSLDIQEDTNLENPGNPPSYDAVIAQQIQNREQRELIGNLLMKLSILVGMHLFKAPYQCNGDVCHRRTFRARVCPIAVTLCILNILVISNHFRLHVLLFNEESQENTAMKSIFSSEKAELLMEIVDCALPMICVLGMIFTSYHMHNLLRKLTETQFNVIQKRCNVKFWRIVLYCINFFFVVGAILELPQNFMKEIKETNATTILDKPLKDMDSNFDRIMIAVDRYYFPIVNFGVVKIPQ